MEERIIDDEYGRGIRLKKTKDGYVDVTDELAEDQGGGTEEEIVFAFPDVGVVVDEEEGDDEDLVDLTPEQADLLRKQKAEEKARKKAKYERLCQMGQDLLDTGSFHAAELKYEKALMLDKVATEASVGYWRAKTANFTDPDVLVSEYVDVGIENLEFDLGYEAVEIIKAEHKDAFEKRLKELEEEEGPLESTIEEKRVRRREILQARKFRAAIVFACAVVPTFVVFLMTVFVGMKNFTTREDYILPTVILSGVFCIMFMIFILTANRYINACRMCRKNEKLSATEEGKRLLKLRDYKELYEALLFVPEYEEEADETEETEE